MIAYRGRGRWVRHQYRFSGPICATNSCFQRRALFRSVAIAVVLFFAAGAQSQGRAQRVLVAEFQYEMEETMPLSRVRGIAVDRFGGIYIADENEGAIARISPSGGFQGRIGGPGQGPGEFQRLIRVGILGDTLWAVDRALRRLVLFNLRGEHIATLSGRIRGELDWPEFPTPELPEALIRGGIISSLTSTTPTAHGLIRVLGTRGEVVTPLLRVEYARQSLVVQGPRGVQVTRFQPLDDTPLWQASPDGSRVVVLERPAPVTREAASVTLRTYLPNGSVATTSCTYIPTPVTNEAKAEMVRSAVGMHGNMFRGDNRALEEAVRQGLQLPDFRPPITQLTVGSDSAIWMQLATGAGSPVTEWLVIDASGRQTTSVSGPPGVSILAASETHAWGVREDADGVPQVIRYRILFAESELTPRHAGWMQTCTTTE